MKAAEWIDRAKARNGWSSDYRAAKELGLSRNTISTYRGDNSKTMDDETAVRVAAALGELPEVVLIDQVAERTRSDEARTALAGLLRRLGWAPSPPSDAKGGLYIM
jgi:transcriptional regulator with XRE-family HTH domain